MACFLVPTTEAIVTTVIKHQADKAGAQNPFLRHMNWLNNMLWGGSALLAFEHVWHGEVVPWYPFLTAMSDPVDKAEMLHEMATVGVAMAVSVTAVWGAFVAFVSVKVKKANKLAESKGE